MKQPNKESFSCPTCQRIRLVTAERGWSNIELAEKSDVSYRTIYSIMHGAATPRNRIVGRIASALGVSAEYLLTGHGDRQVATMMVKEGRPYGEARTASPCTVDAAMKTLAVQFGIPAEEILKMITDWIVKHNHKDEQRK